MGGREGGKSEKDWVEKREGRVREKRLEGGKRRRENREEKAGGLKMSKRCEVKESDEKNEATEQNF